MKIQSPYVVSALVLLFTAPAAAQTSADRAHTASTFVGGTAIGSRGARLRDSEQVEVRIPLPPLRFSEQTLLAPSLGYDSRWAGRDNPAVEPSDSAAPVDGDRNFHRFQLGLTLVHPLSARWRGILGMSGKLTTDFQENTTSLSRDGMLTGFAMGLYNIGGDPNFVLTLGIASTYPVVTLPVFPMIGLGYRREPYIVELGLPRSSLLYQPWQGVEVGLLVAFEREAFRTRFNDLPMQHVDAVYLQQTALRVGPALNVDLGANLWLSSSVGVDVLNDFSLLDVNRDRLDADASTQPAPYVRLLIGWRPPRPTPPPAPGPIPLRRTPPGTQQASLTVQGDSRTSN